MSVRRAAPAEPQDPGIEREVERFLYREARLLDERRYREWLKLFTKDLRYWMPVRSNRLSEGPHETWAIEKELTGEHEVAYFDDDLELLRRRIKRFESGMAWAENPPSRTRHLVTNVDVQVEVGSNVEEYLVRSYCLVYQSRLDTNVSIYTGERFDLLRRIEGSLKISRRKIILDCSTLAVGNLSILF